MADIVIVEQEQREIIIIDETQPPEDCSNLCPRFEFLQNSALTVWTVSHNLGFRPNVKAWSVGGSEMLAEIIHVSLNQVNLYFDDPVAGFATFS